MKRLRTTRSGKQPCLPLLRTTANGVARPEALRRAWELATPFDDSGRATHGTATSKAACGYGFTLIEMLVAVTLVLLMMVMFGEMFQLASASVTKQRVMADNDQNARTFVTVIRADLDKRSFRTLIPFFAGEPVDRVAPFDHRRGYFYISNNNLNDGTDDVLQFTADVSVKVQNKDVSPFFGKAVPLGGNFLNNPNQPDRDDLQITSNQAGAANAAEISYWMREGRLYRRVMLVRDQEGTEAQPQASNPTTALYFQPPSPVLYTGNFWNDFDYSAHRFAGSAPQYAIFHGTDSLSNKPPPTGTLFYSLGETWHRFGHNHERLPNSPLNGLPREFSSNVAPNFFIGRFTHQETSDPNFMYPHQQTPVVAGIGTSGNPMDGNITPPTTLALLDASPRDGVIDQFQNGNRTGVDLLLSHVQEFRVEVWDERLNDFAPIGHSLPFGGTPATWGDYNFNRRLNSTFGPLGGLPNVFDSWHPLFDRNANGLGDEADRPPYRPLTIDPTGVSGPIYTNPSGASLWWTPNTNYQVNDIVFPRAEDLNGNGVLDPGEDGANGFPANGVLDRRLTEDANGNNMLDPGEDGTFGFPADGALNSTNPPFFPFGSTIAYRCVRGGRSGPWSSNEPSGTPPNWGSAGQWKTSVGIDGIHEDRNGNGALDPGEDKDSDGQIDPNEDYFGDNNGVVAPWEDLNSNGNNDLLPDEPDWRVEYNVRPLRAIRITVRFEHPTSKQMKQITIVHSLRDTTSVP